MFQNIFSDYFLIINIDCIESGTNNTETTSCVRCVYSIISKKIENIKTCQRDDFCFFVWFELKMFNKRD